MKEQRMSRKGWVVFILIFLIILTSCSPATVAPSKAASSTNTRTIVPTATQTLTQTPLPTDTLTPLPPTSTNTPVPTPDYSQIQLYGTYQVNNSYGTFTQVILEMGNLEGEFYGVGNDDKYKCQFRKDIPTQLDCIGNSISLNTAVNFSLYTTTQPEAVFRTYYRFSAAMPTPDGMVCEVEGLWTDIIKSRGYISEPGCYAVTCWINGVYYGGVQDSCKEYWPWIPPGLVATPLPTHTP
jgi:hypothetical protein